MEIIDYLAMEGAGLYIWPPYFLTFVFMAGLWLCSWYGMRGREGKAETLRRSMAVDSKETERKDTVS